MNAPVRRVQVKRTIVYEGDEEWVYRTIGGRAIKNTKGDAGHAWLNNGDLKGPRKIYEEPIEIIQEEEL